MSWTEFFQVFILTGWGGLWVAAIVKSIPTKANTLNKHDEI